MTVKTVNNSTDKPPAGYDDEANNGGLDPNDVSDFSDAQNDVSDAVKAALDAGCDSPQGGDPDANKLNPTRNVEMIKASKFAARLAVLLAALSLLHCAIGNEVSKEVLLLRGTILNPLSGVDANSIAALGVCENREDIEGGQVRRLESSAKETQSLFRNVQTAVPAWLRGIQLVPMWHFY
ncbi:MAG TPA: hypothetical protein VGH90_12240, partial [Chthoniobacteraceae bacterium]